MCRYIAYDHIINFLTSDVMSHSKLKRFLVTLKVIFYPICNIFPFCIIISISCYLYSNFFSTIFSILNRSRPGRTGRSPARNPHRPGRAQLRHPVLPNKDSLDVGVDNTRVGQWNTFQELFELHQSQPPFTRPSS